MTERLTILIIGGYGTFGRRLVRLLADEPQLTLLVAGRSADKAAASCRSLGGRAELRPARFDRDGDLEAQIAVLRPHLVIDATGPFQTYGEAPYRVPRACIAAGVSYLDLADGAAFVAGITVLDAEARAKGVFALSGASTCPALTGAVVRHLAPTLTRISRIAVGIAPSPHAEVGPNVVRALAGYAGQPATVWRQARLATAPALTELRRFTVAPPGVLPLQSRLFALVDVPDPQVLGPRRPGLRNIWVGAGIAPQTRLLAMAALAWLVRLQMLPSLAPLADVLVRASGWFRWGEDRGGMIVEAQGLDHDGSAVTASWHLLAEQDSGPFVPCMAAAALVGRCLGGMPPLPGARPASDALELADFAPMFAAAGIRTGTRHESGHSQALPLYRRLAGDAWPELPPTVQANHDASHSTTAEGRASVELGSNPLARLAASLAGFPPAADDVPVVVTFERSAEGETWTRQFGRHRFRSDHSQGCGRNQHLVVERFGPLAFGLAVVVQDGRLSLPVRRWSAFGIPMPLRLAPTSKASESEAEGRFRFDVELGHPLVGRIVRYRGWLVPTSS